MTLKVRNVTDAVLFAAVKAINDTLFDTLTTEVHNAVSGRYVTGDLRDPVQSDLQVTAANASDLATLLTVSNDIRVTYVQHAADTHSHDMADGTNQVAAPFASDLTTAQTLLNEVKADYNAHRSQASVHPNNDAGNAIAAADATNQATAETLANEIKTDLNLHINDALVGQSIQVAAP